MIKLTQDFGRICLSLVGFESGVGSAGAGVPAQVQMPVNKSSCVNIEPQPDVKGF